MSEFRIEMVREEKRESYVQQGERTFNTSGACEVVAVRKRWKLQY